MGVDQTCGQVNNYEDGGVIESDGEDGWLGMMKVKPVEQESVGDDGWQGLLKSVGVDNFSNGSMGSTTASDAGSVQKVNDPAEVE